MPKVVAAVAWVSRHAAGAVQQSPSSEGAAANNVSLGGAVREGGKKRAPNVFQGAGKLKVVEWYRILKLCQDAWEGCCPTTSIPEGLHKQRPKRCKGVERGQWRATVDGYTLALMESFGHRDLVQTKNPDYAIRTSV